MDKRYLQIVFSMRFKKGQCDYFGKKVTTLYVDFFLLRDNEEIIKRYTFYGMIDKQMRFSILCLLLITSLVNFLMIFPVLMSSMQNQIILHVIIVTSAKDLFTKFVTNLVLS